MSDHEMHAWQRAVGGWHTVFGILAVLTATLVLIAGDASTFRQVATLLLLAIFCGWYWTMGARALSGTPRRFGASYLVGAIPLVIALFSLDVAGSLMLFVLYPHIWMLLRFRGAVISTAATVVAIGVVGIAHSGVDARSVLQVAGGAGAFLLVGLLLGVWITKIIEQSRQRARLVAELESTRAELATVSHDAGVLAERERLAREIHDTLAQGFTSMLMLLQAMEPEIAGDPDAVRRRLAQLERTARDNLAEARTLVALLTPTHLEAASLSEALRRLIGQVGRELGITATLTVAGSPRALPANHEVVLLRSTQEALANVRKHARAACVTARLDYQDERITLEVRDDGRGFDPATTSHGFGLAGMGSRVLQVGGTIEVNGTRGSGVNVLIALPCPAHHGMTAVRNEGDPR